MSQSPALADFACDYCRHRKIKCSRETPKCSNCIKWPGPCKYTHEKKSSSESNITHPQAVLPRRPASKSVEDRLEAVESKIDALTTSIRDLTRILQGTYPIANRPQHSPSTPPSLAGDGTKAPREYTRNEHASWFLKQAASDLEVLEDGIQQPSLNGSESLQELSRSFAAVHFEDDSVMQEAKKASKSAKMYYVPDRTEGDALIQKFSSLLAVGGPLFTRPDPQTLQEVTFRPSEVTPIGWVVVFNLLLLTSTGRQDDDALRVRLRWNAWLALNEATLLLEPCEVNIQALLFVASHGEDFATPNLSFIVVGHACRLAQALDLHLVRPTADEQQRQTRLFLFWSLFIIDKSVALAFGRSAMLSASFYDQVPLPDSGFLSRFNPHQFLYGQDIHESPPADASSPSSFGAFVVLQNISLARLSGKIASFLTSVDHEKMSGHNSIAISIEKDHLKVELENWYNQTYAAMTKAKELDVLVHIEAARSEMDLGVETMLFQYLHLLVLLTRGFEDERQVCLDTARRALSMLNRLISTSQQVYNGIVWLLLYYPFTPFFVLFGNLTRRATAEDAAQDLQLLQSTACYFSQMTSQGNMAGRLEKVARVFSTIAETCINSARNPDSTVPFTDFPNMDSLPVPSLLPHFPRTSHADFLNFGIPDQQLQQQPTSVGHNTPLLVNGDHGDTMRGTKRSLECTFDWFSWDLNNSDGPD